MAENHRKVDMANPITALGAAEASNMAVRQSIIQDRDNGATAQKEAAKEPIFEGAGSSEPHLGNVVDVEA